MHVEKNLFFIEEQFLVYNLNAMQEHLIIDGNNAMHAIPSLMKELLRDRNFARTSLLSMLVPLISVGNRVTVVFDGRAGKGSLEKYEGMDGFDVFYSSSSEGADGAIERMVMAARFPGKICVVTNDQLIRNCAYANGSSTMRVDQLLKQLDHSIDQMSRKAQQTRFSKKGVQASFHNRIEFPDLQG